MHMHARIYLEIFWNYSRFLYQYFSFISTCYQNNRQRLGFMLAISQNLPLETIRMRVCECSSN
jgi:hypothetical protein